MGLIPGAQFSYNVHFLGGPTTSWDPFSVPGDNEMSPGPCCLLSKYPGGFCFPTNVAPVEFLVCRDQLGLPFPFVKICLVNCRYPKKG